MAVVSLVGLLSLTCLAEDTNTALPDTGLVIRSWGTQAGLPQNTINAILQASPGYLWLGTREGLSRFDGVRFRNYTLREGLPSLDIRSLEEDYDGSLWIGTGGGGLCRMTGGKIRVVPLPQEGSGTEVISVVKKDAPRRIWVGTSGGLFVWAHGEFITLPALEPIAREPIRAIHHDRQGRTWIATSISGLWRYAEGKLTACPGPAEVPVVQAYCLIDDQHSNLWAPIGNGQILRLDNSGKWHTFTTAEGVPFAYVTSMVEDARGQIWAGSLDAGLYRLVDGRFQALRRQDGLSSDDIRSLLTDNEGNLWVGTRTAGINRIKPRGLLPFGAEHGLTNDYTRSIAQTADGHLWVATVGGGLYRSAVPSAQLRLHTGPAEGLFQRFAPNDTVTFFASIETVLAHSDGSLWWGGARALLQWRDGALSGVHTNHPWVRSAAITALLEDPSGDVWIGTSQGNLVRRTKDTFVSFPQPVARGAIVSLAVEPTGVLWVGSEAGGLVRIDPDPLRVTPIREGLGSQVIRTLYLDKENTLWVGTAGGGLGRVRNGKAFSFTPKHGLPVDAVLQIVEADDGDLWLGSTRGVLRVSKQHLNDLADGKLPFVHPRTYGEYDGMPAEECSTGFSPAGLKTRDGLICFSTVRGLVLFPGANHAPAIPPPVVLLEEVLVNGNEATIGRDQAGDTLTVSPRKREIEIRFTGISLSAPERVRFRYRLRGVDQDWVEAGTRRSAFYYLPPGEFTFDVAAANVEGVWSEVPGMLQVTARPFAWERAWFIPGITLLLASAVGWAIYIWQRRRYARKVALLQAQNAIERERLRISQDMHDHLGGMLTQVSQITDMAQGETANTDRTRAHLEKIGTQARSAVQALDEIVWATNPRNDNLPSFADYISRFADEFFESTGQRCWQEVPANLPRLPISAEVRHNIFLAVKEALNNIAKHSGATEIWLRLSVQALVLTIELQDNGKGFEASSARHGNGLDNIRSRLKDCGGTAEIRSEPGRGTTVRMQLLLSGGL